MTCVMVLGASGHCRSRAEEDGGLRTSARDLKGRLSSRVRLGPVGNRM